MIYQIILIALLAALALSALSDFKRLDLLTEWVRDLESRINLIEAEKRYKVNGK